MPIKFRCSYCRQFLGISRGRAGGVVDCPTCGRSIRVPELDGMVAPVPSPELNLRDAKLARALEELAHWNAPQSGPVASESEEEEELPQPIVEPIPIEVPVAPEPVLVQPPPLLEPVMTGSGPGTSQNAEEPSMSVAAAIAELTEIAAAPSSLSATAADSPRWSVRGQRRAWLAWWSAAVLAVVVAFAGGYAASQIHRSSSATGGHEESQPLAAAEPLRDVAPAISGRITYKTADGQSLADQGARIIVLPREREGTAKFSTVGFRAADHPADVRLVTAALRSIGGDLATADDGGKFAIQLPNPGTFQIVVISNFANRDKVDDIDPELLRILTPYFEQPAQLLGRTKFHFGQVRYKGTGTEIWDHSF